MAGNNEVIGIEVQVKLEQLRSQLATLGPGMEKEAKAMTAALNREIKQQTAAMKRLGTEAATATGSFGKLSGTVGKTAQVAGALGGTVGKLNPEIGATITAVGSLSGVMGGLSAAGVVSMSVLGPVAVAVAALGVAYLALSNNLQKAEAAQSKMAEAATAAQTAHEGVEQVVTAISDRLAIASGQATRSSVEQRKQIQAVNDAFDVQARVVYGLAASEAVRLEQMTALEQKRATAIEAIKLTAELEDRAAAKAEAAAKAAASAAEVKAAEAKAAADTAAMYDRDERARAQARAAAIWEAASDDVRAAEMAYRQKVALYQQEAEEKEVIRRADLELAEMAAAEEVQARSAASNAIVSLMESTTTALGMFSDSMKKKNRAQALQAFAAAKVVAISSALLNTALAVTNALATVPYPAAPIAAAAAAVSGGVQIAAIAAEKPSFHRGGIVEEQGRGEVSARLLPGEAVLNRQATSALGAGGVDALNSGGGSGGGSVSLRIGRLEAREVIRTDIAAGGLVVQTARAAVATGGNRAGRTGRRPIG